MRDIDVLELAVNYRTCQYLVFFFPSLFDTFSSQNNREMKMKSACPINPLTPKIWLLILLSSFYTIPGK